MIKIEINSSKCPYALGCLKCLEICPSGVLLVLTTGNPFAKKAKGRIKPAFMNLCSGCGKCSAICSKGAITIVQV
ncbi:MAG: hypothetical protein JL50_04465 [Peptococcaceae bacterium BICA1-7]|nr:MAG: hypothetical protein JL50_04465 [Peptococcaceae bacterium BICA1-7]HBV95877.1 hypothetical protein [Desulfotomaculum sp.]